MIKKFFLKPMNFQRIFENYLFSDVFISMDYQNPATQGNIRNFDHELLLHEIGHAIGLKHPFINTTGDGGTLIELDENKNIIWDIKLGLNWPSGSGYRAYRVPSLHPGIFSIYAANYKSIQTLFFCLDS